MRIILPFLLVLFSLNLLGRESFVLSSQATISIITCAPGDEIFDCFGHTAVRVNDDDANVDVVFNYGIYEFNDPNFELNFAKGYMKYKLGINGFKGFLPLYTRDDRTITEQVLNLDSVQKQSLFDFIVWNEKPENRYYFYDYFYDNCATRIRDVVANNSDADVIYNDSFALKERETVRGLVKRYAHNNLWGMLGIDLCLGQQIDRKIPDSVYSFLPEYFMNSLDNATINGAPLVGSKKTLYEGTPRSSTPWSSAPTTYFWLISLLLFGLTLVKSPAFVHQTTDVLLFAITGFLGCFLLSLWLFTDHATTQLNFNMLWAMPLNIVIPFLPKAIKRKYYLIYGLIQVLVLLNWLWFPQDLNNAFFPLIALLAFRGWKGYQRLK